MISLAQYEKEQDYASNFDDALESYLDNTYTYLGEGRYYDTGSEEVFTINDGSVKFEGGEEGEGFSNYKELVDDPEELSYIIGQLLADANSK